MLYCLAQFPEMLPEMWKIDLIFTLVGLFNWSRPAPPVRFFFSFHLQPNLGLMFSYFICTMYGMHGAISRLSAHPVGGETPRSRDSNPGWVDLVADTLTTRPPHLTLLRYNLISVCVCSPSVDWRGYSAFTSGYQSVDRLSDIDEFEESFRQVGLGRCSDKVL